MRVAIAVALVASTVLLAGCPGTDQARDVDPEGNETEFTENEAGAHPKNPQNGSTAAPNGSEATGTATGTPPVRVGPARP